jgi:predicted ribosomally synthesized peptide with nif11-like leader
MSEEQIQALINAVKSDTALQERLKAAPDLDAVVAIAKEAGFVVTKAEVLQAQAQSVELTDRELEDVMGGGGRGETVFSCETHVCGCPTMTVC